MTMTCEGKKYRGREEKGYREKDTGERYKEREWLKESEKEKEGGKKRFRENEIEKKRET